MAQCDPDVLMADASSFVNLTAKEQAAIQAQLVYEWSGSTQTAQEILDQAECFLCMTSHNLTALIAQLLCDISEA